MPVMRHLPHLIKMEGLEMAAKSPLKTKPSQKKSKEKIKKETKQIKASPVNKSIK